MRYFAAGSRCPVCLKFFHTRSGLSIHLEKNERCYLDVQSCWPLLQHQEVEDLDQIDREAEKILRDKGWWASKALQPVLQAFGPRLPLHPHEASAIMFAKYDPATLLLLPIVKGGASSIVFPLFPLSSGIQSSKVLSDTRG